jgi:hypothetical protein
MDEKETAIRQDEEVRSNDVFAEDTVKVQNPKLAAILETHKPNPWGKGYLRLYAFSALLFLCSTMNGKLPSKL